MTGAGTEGRIGAGPAGGEPDRRGGGVEAGGGGGRILGSGEGVADREGGELWGQNTRRTMRVTDSGLKL